MENRIEKIENDLEELKLKVNFLIENNSQQLEVVNYFTSFIKDNNSLSKKFIDRIESLENHMNKTVDKINEITKTLNDL